MTEPDIAAGILGSAGMAWVDGDTLARQADDGAAMD